MNRSLLCAASLTLGIAYSPLAFGQADARGPGDDGTFLSLKYSIWGGSRDTESFDDTVEDESREDLYQRFTLDVGVELTSSLSARITTDLVTGQLAGDDPFAVPDAFRPNNANFERTGNIGDTFESVVDPYNAYIQYQSVFLARLGLQTSQNGLGLVANDGSGDALFNVKYGGDRSLRLLLGARPFALSSDASRAAKKITLAIGADYVYRDDNASILDEDRALQGVAALFYADQNPQNPDEEKFLGAYFAYRDQEDESGETLNVAAIDLSGRIGWMNDSDTWFYSLGFESALIAGSTTRAFTQSGNEETDILAFGTAVEAQAKIVPLDIAFKLNAGYASGDADPDDDTVFRFRFDPNYKVGLVLFDHYIPAMTRLAYERATDPTRTGEPPKGIDGLISDGAVENALYINPQILFGEEDGLLGGVGFLWAQSAVKLADPFNSFSSGGTPVGINGGEGSRDLGIEIDAAIRYRQELFAGITGEAKIEYGIFFPGKAFDDASGNTASPQNLVRGHLGLKW